MTTPRTLTQMQNRPTSYEVVFVHNNEETRLGFTQRRTKKSLLNMAQENSELLLDKLSSEQLDKDWSYNKNTGLEFTGSFVRFSGRTERDLAEI